LGHLEQQCFKKNPELAPDKPRNQEGNKKEINKDRSSLLYTSTTTIHPHYSRPTEIGPYFILDSGATEHWTPNKEWLEDYTPERKTVYLANNATTEALGYGNIDIQVYNDKTKAKSPITISKVYYIPNIATNLLSIKRILDKGWSIKANKDRLIISNDKIIMSANWIANLCRLQFSYKSYNDRLYLAKHQLPIDLIHQRLAHFSNDYIAKTIANTKGLEQIQHTIENSIACKPCLEGKSHKTKGQNKLSDSLRPLELIHTDIAGPFLKSLNSKRYIITFIDDYTRSIFIYPIATKGEAIDKLRHLYSKLEASTDLKIARIRADNAKEFKSIKWNKYTKEKGIITEYTAPYSPEQNGIAERYNRIILDHARAVITAKKIPLKLWPWVFESIGYILNRVYSKPIGKTPYEALIGSKPDISNLRILGSLVYRLIPKETRNSKLEPLAEEGILIGYVSTNYQVYIPETDTVRVIRDLEILENESYISEDNEDLDLLEEEEEAINTSITSIQPAKTITIELPSLENREEYLSAEESEVDELASQQLARNDELVNQQLDNKNDKPVSQQLSGNDESTSQTSSDESSEEETPITRPRRSNRIQNQAYIATTAYLAIKEEEEKDEAPTADIKEPNSYKDAIASQERDLWLKAMDKEISTLKANNTWTLMDLPPNTKPISTRWVYKIKKNDDKTLSYKARLVARGFEQIYGLNYYETFAAVIKQQAFKLIFAIATLNAWPIHKIDMKSAFTQGDIGDDTIYLSLPDGYKDPKNRKGLLLNRALYGLKQAANIWYNLLAKELQAIGFTQLQNDTCIYYNRQKKTIIIVYVDDIAITGPDVSYIQEIITKLSKRFSLTDLGPIKAYLGIDITRSKDLKTTILSQKDYIVKILKRFGMEDSRPVNTPIEPGFIQQKYKGQATKEDIKWYQQAIGSLLYASLLTRPDIAYTTSVLGRYASNPGPEHIKAVKRVFRYLNGNQDHTTSYNTNIANSQYIKGYTDADYAGDKEEYKSTTGYIFYLANGPVSHLAKLQPITAQSTTEAEYIALAMATKEATYLKALLEELDYFNQSNIPIYTDNNGAIQLAKNPSFHAKSKHINVRYHLIR
jgi:hypothetical protein